MSNKLFLMRLLHLLVILITIINRNDYNQIMLYQGTNHVI